ncbi:MAG: ribose-phosphate pyrophosphokinase [Rhizobiaceae bacterium]|nr:ribose-phosphate pyrophosphokinase [Pseudomonadota bacterium]
MSAAGPARLVLPLSGNESFAADLAKASGWQLGRIETRRFPDGESYVRIRVDVTGRSVGLVCTLARPDENFLPLIFAADAARSLGAKDVTLVAPYLSYMRQDRRFQPGEAVTSTTFARLVSSTFDRMITVDPHLHRYPSLSAVYTIPTDALHAAPLLSDWIAENVRRPLIVGPDIESEQWVSAIASRIAAPYAVLRKLRHGDRNVDIDVPDLSRWRGHQPVLVDDIASSGRTMIEAARKLPLQGFAMPVCAVVHGIFAEDSFSRLQAVSQKIVSTDSVAHVSNAISLAPLVAAALGKSDSSQANLTRHRRPPEPMIDDAGEASVAADNGQLK